MANIDSYRPPQRAYEPPTARSRSREIPPAAPSPPVLSTRNSPPRPTSRRSAPTPSRPSPEPPSPTTRRKQWLFTEEELHSSPSVLDGLSPEEERFRRAKGVNFIYQAGIVLELPQLTLWVAGTFFHRFFMRRSLVEERGGVHHYNIAATALFLANKTEENCRKTKDIIIAVARVAQKNSKLIIDEQSKEYWRWRDSILAYEEAMLELLTFDLMIDNPFPMIYTFLKDLKVDRNKAIRHAAWSYCNDACLTALPLLFDACDIAVSAIFFASVFSGEPIDDTEDGQPWWKSFDTTEENCTQAIDVMVKFYKENPLRKPDNPLDSSRSPRFVLDGTRRRGETISSQRTTSSAAGTPTGTDRAGTHSPVMQASGTGETYETQTIRESQDTQDAASAGDSDAALKVAANNLDSHKTDRTDANGNGNGMRSPSSKRKTPDGEGDADERGSQSKRARLD